MDIKRHEQDTHFSNLIYSLDGVVAVAIVVVWWQKQSKYSQYASSNSTIASLRSQ